MYLPASSMEKRTRYTEREREKERGREKRGEGEHRRCCTCVTHHVGCHGTPAPITTLFRVDLSRSRPAGCLRERQKQRVAGKPVFGASFVWMSRRIISPNGGRTFPSSVQLLQAASIKGKLAWVSLVPFETASIENRKYPPPLLLLAPYPTDRLRSVDPFDVESPVLRRKEKSSWRNETRRKILSWKKGGNWPGSNRER